MTAVGVLALEGIALRVLLGATDEERLAPSTAVLDLEWRGELPCSGPAVDYADVCSALETLTGRSFPYIEDLAGEILGLLCKGWPGHWTVSVSKPCPPVRLPLGRARFVVEGDGI